MAEFDNLADLGAALGAWLASCTDEERAHFHAEQEAAKREMMANPDAAWMFEEQHQSATVLPFRKPAGDA